MYYTNEHGTLKNMVH